MKTDAFAMCSYPDKGVSFQTQAVCMHTSVLCVLYVYYQLLWIHAIHLLLHYHLCNRDCSRTIDVIQGDCGKIEFYQSTKRYNKRRNSRITLGMYCVVLVAIHETIGQVRQTET